jgi:hypothetical protein
VSAFSGAIEIYDPVKINYTIYDNRDRMKKKHADSKK